MSVIAQDIKASIAKDVVIPIDDRQALGGADADVKHWHILNRKEMDLLLVLWNDDDGTIPVETGGINMITISRTIISAVSYVEVTKLARQIRLHLQPRWEIMDCSRCLFS